MEVSKHCSPRLAPLEPPYTDDIAAAFARVMPPGLPPLKLFRTMAHNPRVLQRLFAGNFLDQGSISLRQRELLILRTCARCGAEYEWGVHVHLFGARAELSERDIGETLKLPLTASAWSEADALLLSLADSLHDSAGVDDALWEKLQDRYTTPQLLEMIAIVGSYHTIAFIANATGVNNEDYAACFAQYGG